MSFYENDSSFSLDTTSLDSTEKLGSGLWLVLVGINEIPPHIALISEGKYYSLSARKVDCGTSLERLTNTLERKQIPTLFVNIEEKTTESANAIASSDNYRGEAIPVKSLQKIYKDLQPLGNSENTCLSPIKDFFAECYSREFTRISYVFELLALCEKKGLLKECLSLYAENTNSNRITLPKYTMAQIRNKINTLSTPITVIK